MRLSRHSSTANAIRENSVTQAPSAGAHHMSAPSAITQVVGHA
jgi:hypothetical protein